ncbi:MAG: MFS transporter [Lacunisphaera sp.]
MNGSCAALLFLATLVNYLDRQTISVSASKIAAEMHLTDGNLGQLFFGFLFAYGIAQLFVGAWLDRLGTVAAYAVAVAAWSFAGASSALVPTFALLLLTRILLGLCESPNWPLALRVVARTFPPGPALLRQRHLSKRHQSRRARGPAHHHLYHGDSWLADVIPAGGRRRARVVGALARLVPVQSPAGTGPRRRAGRRGVPPDPRRCGKSSAREPFGD